MTVLPEVISRKCFISAGKFQSKSFFFTQFIVFPYGSYYGENHKLFIFGYCGIISSPPIGSRGLYWACKSAKISPTKFSSFFSALRNESLGRCNSIFGCSFVLENQFFLPLHNGCHKYAHLILNEYIFQDVDRDVVRSCIAKEQNQIHQMDNRVSYH